MNVLTSFGFENETEIVEINSGITLEIRGVSFRMLCMLSKEHLPAMNEMIVKFDKEYLVKHKDFFDDLLLQCIVSKDELDREDLKKIRSTGRMKILKTIYKLTMFDEAFIKKYKRKIRQKKGSKLIGAVEAAEQKYRKEAIADRAKAIGMPATFENLIHMCEYLITKNVTNAYDLSIRGLYNKYKVHVDIENLDSKRLINVLSAMLYMHHGEPDQYNELINNLSDI